MDGMKLMDINFHKDSAGRGFWVVLFHWEDGGGRYRRMVASVFPEPGAVCVFDILELFNGNIHPGRGANFHADYFEPTLRDWVESYRSLGNPQRPAV